jgi:F0F1-type ATP synthase membrane subunit b/b'
MPQFDLFSFFVQIVYVSMAFATFYLLNEYLLLVRLSRVLKARRKSIELSAQLMARERENRKVLYNTVIKLALSK